MFMNILTKILTATVLTISSIGMANASSEVVPSDNYVTTNICVVATQGNKLKLLYAIKNSGLRKSYIANNVKCNKLNIIAFIEEHGSNVEEIGNFLTNGRYTNDGDVTNIAAK